MKLVAQEFNVMPYISVAENIATHLDRTEQRARRCPCRSASGDLWRLKTIKNTMVKNLSGGQKTTRCTSKGVGKHP